MGTVTVAAMVTGAVTAIADMVTVTAIRASTSLQGSTAVMEGITAAPGYGGGYYGGYGPGGYRGYGQGGYGGYYPGGVYGGVGVY